MFCGCGGVGGGALRRAVIGFLCSDWGFVRAVVVELGLLGILEGMGRLGHSRAIRGL